MTSLGAWLTLLAVLVAIVGIVWSARQQPRTRVLGLLATLLLTVVTFWFAWLSSTVT